MKSTKTGVDIDRITLQVYRARLDDNWPGDADKMVVRDKDQGQKQAGRAVAYRVTVVETLIAVGLYERPSRGKVE